MPNVDPAIRKELEAMIDQMVQQTLNTNTSPVSQDSQGVVAPTPPQRPDSPVVSAPIAPINPVEAAISAFVEQNSVPKDAHIYGPVTNPQTGEPWPTDPKEEIKSKMGTPEMSKDIITAQTMSETTPRGYQVQSGDNLTKIAEAHGLTLDNLLAMNPQITNPNLIHPGNMLKVTESKPQPQTPSPDPIAQGDPPVTSAYDVQQGDNLTTIAAANGMTLPQLLQLNPGIKDPNLIYPGQQIILK